MIILNGTSTAGKSSIAEQLRTMAFDKPVEVFSLDAILIPKIIKAVGWHVLCHPWNLLAKDHSI